jgi:hypothetical protein
MLCLRWAVCGGYKEARSVAQCMVHSIGTGLTVGSTDWLQCEHVASMCSQITELTHDYTVASESTVQARGQHQYGRFYSATHAELPGSLSLFRCGWRSVRMPMTKHPTAAA